MTLSKLLQGHQVRLDALSKNDLPTLVAWYRDTEFLRFWDSRPASPKNETELSKILEESANDKNIFAFAVRPVNSGELLGYIEIDDIDWPHDAAGIGIGFGDPAHWGRGYGYEASQLALAFAFHELNLHRLTATVFSYNARSVALFEKLGFTREGVFRERLQRDGQRFDMYLYGLLRHEWHRNDRTDG
ncbi:MAG: GNAT family N-acetyltransferase [Chloroflexota bacterium]